MSRLFNMLSGAVAIRPEPTTPPRPTVVPVVDEQSERDDDGGFAEGIDDVPFVEIGGPSGPVFSGSIAQPQPKPVSPADATPPSPTVEPAVAPLPREYPRLAETQRYVSVSFHTLAETKPSAIPVDGPDLGLVALHIPDHPISGEYRALRDAIREQLPEPTPRVLHFVAGAAAAGTTSVLLNLAVTLAREESPRVLAIDANFSRPALARMMALKSTPGLAEVLVKQIPLAWAVQATAVPHLEVLPLGAITAATAEAFRDDFPQLLEQLRQWYDWVLIDAGVWGVVPERDHSCTAADAVYLVTRAAAANQPTFADLRTTIRQSGGLLRGYVATRV